MVSSRGGSCKLSLDSIREPLIYYEFLYQSRISRLSSCCQAVDVRDQRVVFYHGSTAENFLLTAIECL